MASYTALLKLTQPDLGATGWGTTVNSGVTALVEQAVAGAVSVAVTTAGPNTLSAITSGASSDARNQFIILTGTLASPATLTLPAAPGATSSKLYFVKNTAGDTVTVETSGGTSVAVPDGASMMLKVTTAGVEEAMTHAASLTLGTALGAVSGGTGQSSYAIGDLLYASGTTALSKLAAVAEGSVLRAKGTGTAPAWEQVVLTTDVTGVLPVANGGTGAATLAANNVLLGNGTSAVQEVAPGSDGNVLTASAGTWVSSPLPPAGVTSLNSQTGAVVTTSVDSIGSYSVLIVAVNSNLAYGATISGSDLRYSWTANSQGGSNLNTYNSNYAAFGTSYGAGGTALSGTWRKMSSGNTYTYDISSGFSYWIAALYVRIS